MQSAFRYTTPKIIEDEYDLESDYEDTFRTNKSSTSPTCSDPVLNSDDEFKKLDNGLEGQLQAFENEDDNESVESSLFSPLTGGSVRSSIFSLCASALGAEYCLPSVLALNGYVLGLGLILLGAIGATWSNQILAKMSSETGLRNIDELAMAAGGNCLKKTITYMIMIYTFGACCSYQILIGQLFQCVFWQLANDKTLVHDSESRRLAQGIPTALFLVLPLCFQREVSALRHVHLFSLAALLYATLVLVAEAPSYYEYYQPKADIAPAYWDLNIFSGFSITVFAYTCQGQTLLIYQELQRPSYKRMNKVITRSVGTLFTIYTTIAIAGFVSTFQFTESVVLKRHPLPDEGTDPAITVAVACTMIYLVATYQANYNPFRQQFFAVIMGREEYSEKENMLCTIAFVSTTTFISIQFPKIRAVLSLLSGLTAVPMSFVMPLIFLLRLGKRPICSCEVLTAIIFFSTLTLFGLASVAVTLYEMKTGIDKMPRWQ